MKRRLLVIFIIPCLLLSVVAPFINPPKAAADPKSDIQNATFTFQDRATIVGNLGSTYGQVDFVDDNINDSNHNYVPTSGDFCDKHGIDLHSGTLNWSAPSIYADTVELGYQTGNVCTKVTLTMKPVTNPTDANTGKPVAASRFQWNSSDISTLNGQNSDATFTPAANVAGLYIEQTSHNSECHAYAAIYLNPGSTSQGTLYTFDNSQDDYTSIPGLGDVPPDGTTKPANAYSTIASAFGSNCQVISGAYHPYTVTIGGQQGVAAPGATTPGGAGGTSPDCTTQLSQDLLSWIICPVVGELTKVIGWVDNIITNEMDVKTDAIFCSDTNACKAYYAAWQSFRDIALGLMVIAGLVLVMAEALGLEMLDTYTIRKTLPRLLIAAIAITLSWPLMRFLIQLSDDLGFGVRSLIYSPFSRLDGSLNLGFGGGLSNVVGSTALLGGAVATWMLAGGAMALLSLLGTAALAVLVAVVILILRQIAIILLMLLAPLALVAYILPNTQRMYKMWWESFSKALLMFPLIAAFIATGRVFSAVSVNNGGAINQLVGFAAYFAPYFMIPLTLRMAGGTVGALGNFANSRAQGGFSALSNVRGQQRKSRLERIRARGLYRRDTRLARGLNRFGHAVFDGDERAPYYLGTGAGRLGKGKYNPLGYAGKKVFGRMAGEQADAKARQYTEQTSKGAELAGLGYAASWAGLGMRHKLAGDMTPEGRLAMDKKYGLDKNGRRTRDGVGAVSWQPPKQGDYHGLLAYGQALKQGGTAGSFARTAGEQLGDPGKAGLISSFGSHMETQRATLESISAATAARNGKLTASDASALRDHMVHEAKGDPAKIAFANAELAHLEAVGQQQNPAIRPFKGIKYDEEGTYSVYSDHQVPVLDDNNNPVMEDDGVTPKMMKAYEDQEALDSLLTAGPGQIAQGKVGEYITETSNAYKHHANQYMDGPPEPSSVIGPDGNPVMKPSRVLTPEAKQLRKKLVSMAGFYGQSDPGGVVKIDALLDDMGVTAAEKMEYTMEGRGRDAFAAGQGGVVDPGVDPGATGGAGPP